MNRCILESLPNSYNFNSISFAENSYMCPLDPYLAGSGVASLGATSDDGAGWSLVQQLGAAAGSLALTFFAFWSGIINTNDICAGSCDFSEEDESSNIHYLQIERVRLMKDPFSCLKMISEACQSNLKLEVKFIGEAGIDGGGLTKELFTLLFSSLLSNKDGSSRDILSFAKEEFSKHNITASEFYKIIFKDIFSYIRRDGSFLIESILDENLLKGVCVLPREGLLEACKSEGVKGAYESPAGKQILLSISTLLNDRHEDEFSSLMNRKCLDFLAGAEVDYFEIERLAQGIEGLDDEDLEELKADMASYRESVYGTIEAHVSGQFFVRAQNAVHCALAVNAQLEKGGVDLFSGVQATFDRSSIVQAIELSDSVSTGNRRALSRKIDFLKTGLDQLATEHEVKHFARFVTGSTVIKPGVRIKIGDLADGVNYISVSSCFDLLLLEVDTVIGRDDTAGNLLRAVLLCMQDPTYTDR